MSKVTTVIPSYRRPHLLRRAVQSVLSQTHTNVEVHVFDDASGDETEAVVRHMSTRDPRVKYYCQPLNRGMMPNTAAAVNSVDSEFFTILNDDDFLAPGFFATALEAFARHPQAGVYAGRLVYWNQQAPTSTQPCRFLDRGYYEAPDASLRSLNENKTHTWTSMMFRREVLHCTNGVDPGAGYAADLDFTLRAMALHDTVVSDLPCAVYCMHPGSSSYASWIAPCVESLRYIQDALQRDPALSAIRSNLLPAYRRKCRKMIGMAAMMALVRGELPSARIAAEFLRNSAGAPIIGRSLRLASSQRLVGACSRLALKSVRAANHARKAVQQNSAWRSHEAFVQSVLEQLARSAAGQP